MIIRVKRTYAIEYSHASFIRQAAKFRVHKMECVQGGLAIRIIILYVIEQMKLT